MGGYGSGRWGCHNTRLTVEDCLALSSARLTRLGILHRNCLYNGPVTWSNTTTGEKTATIGVEVETNDTRGSILLRYTRNHSEELQYGVGLTTTPLPWGGVRWWFLCPFAPNGRSCNKRVGKLYLPPGSRYFGCRRCYDLTYLSCNESHQFDGLYKHIAAGIGIEPGEVGRLLKKGL